MTNFINKNLINIFNDKYDWKTSGYKAAEMLLDNDYITKEFIKAMIGYVEEFGPYIVLAPGIALFHGRPEDGVNKEGVSFNLFKKGVEFGVPEKDPVYLIFVLAPIDNESHIDLLTKISEILSDNILVNKLKECETIDEIYELLN